MIISMLIYLYRVLMYNCKIRSIFTKSKQTDEKTKCYLHHDMPNAIFRWVEDGLAPIPSLSGY